ncbi:MAG: hypothetical protein ACKVT2_03580 [Saprospiraceae bacterium]
MEQLHNSNKDINKAGQSTDPADPAPDAISNDKHERRFKNGLLWIGAGAITLVLSFGINFLCFQCGVDFHIPMYVLTSLGALCLLKGMMNIF